MIDAMVRTVATVVFIGAVAAAAIYMAQRPTYASGTTMAAQLLDGAKAKGITKVRCDDRIPILHDGAIFRCHIEADDGSTAQLEYTLDRAGMLKPKLLTSTGPTGHKIHERTSRDPWDP
jgi:hypothetical protein